MAQTPSRAELLAAAREARARAYAPYSGFSVGAALLAGDGTVVSGCNVESASYGTSMCAERSALFAAVSRGIRAFEALAIAGPENVKITPCGACRQALAEFGDALVIVREEQDDVVLRDLLPDAFGAQTLERARL